MQSCFVAEEEDRGERLVWYKPDINTGEGYGGNVELGVPGFSFIKKNRIVGSRVLLPDFLN